MAEVDFFESVFDLEYCQWLLEDARRTLSKGTEFTRSNYHWGPEVVGSSQPVLIRDFEPIPSKFVLAKLRDRGIIDHFEYVVMCFAWTRLSYIPWHNDHHRKSAITVYLNETWDRDWGGLFLYQGSNETDIRAIVPQFNCALRNTEHLNHATTMITMDAPEPRFTLQLFSRE